MKFRLCVLVILMLIGLNVTAAHAQAAEETRVRFVHAVQGASAVDVYFDGELVYTNVRYMLYTNFVKAAPDTYAIDLREAGAAADSAPVLSTEIKIDAGEQVSVVAIGSPNGPVMLPYVRGKAPEGKALIQVIHGVADVEKLDMLAGETAVSKNIEIGTQRPLPADEGIYSLAFVPAGQKDPALLDLPGAPFVKDVIYTWILTGTSEKVDVIRIADGELFIGAINVSPNAPPVDVYLNDKLQFENIAFKKFSSLSRLESGRYVVSLRFTGTSAETTPIFESAIALPAGVSANLIVLGNLNGKEGVDEMRINAYWGTPILEKGRSGLNLIHGIPGGAEVGLYEGSNAVLDQVAYQDIGTAYGPPKTYNLKVTPAGDTGTTLLPLADYELKEGKQHFIVLTGSTKQVDVLLFYADPFVVLRDNANK